MSHQTAEHPMRRASDGSLRQRLVEARFYRDIWLIFVTVFLYIALNNGFDAIDKVQDERAANVQRSCEDQNSRHDNTLIALQQVTDVGRAKARAAKDQDRIESIDDSQMSTKLLIEALVPKRDCAEAVRRAVQSRVAK